MKRVLAILGGLVMANAFAAIPSPPPRVFPRPACIGTEISPELRGIYKAETSENPMWITLSESSVTFNKQFSTENNKAWTCVKNGALALVVMKGPDAYMSRLILHSGQYLVDLGTLAPSQTIDQKGLQHISSEGGSTVFKKQPQSSFVAREALEQPLPPASNNAPACEGTEITPDLRGTYKSTLTDGSHVTLVLKANTISAGEAANTEKAWSCSKDDALVLVRMHQNLYRSNFVFMSGDYLLVLDEVTKNQSLQPKDIKRQLHEGHVLYLKRETATPASSPRPFLFGQD